MDTDSASDRNTTAKIIAQELRKPLPLGYGLYDYYNEVVKENLDAPPMLQAWAIGQVFKRQAEERERDRVAESIATYTEGR